MSRRTEAKNTSTVYMHVRVTPEERDEAHALARYLSESFSDLIRRLLRDERVRLLAEGKKPPRK